MKAPTILFISILGLWTRPVWSQQMVTVDCGGGSADFSSLQQAVNTASYGTTIRIAEGICREPLIDIPSGLTLIGQGSKTTLEAQGIFALRIFNQEDITLKNFRIVSGPDNIQGVQVRETDHLRIENLEIVNTGRKGNAIEIDGGRYITLRDNRISGAGNHGISLAAMGDNIPTYIAITDNVIEHTVASCINISTSHNVSVRGNHTKACGSTTSQYGGIRAANSSQSLTIQGNTISNAARGIFITTNSSDVTVTGNTIADSLIHGVLIENAKNITFTGNLIKNTLGEDAGIRLSEQLDGIIVSSNHVTNSQGFGIRLYNSNNANVSIVGNLLSCNKRGNLSLPTQPDVHAEANHEQASPCDP